MSPFIMEKSHPCTETFCNLSCQECLLCPSGFAANMAVMTAVTSLAPGTVKGQENVVAIFSDALNHASIIDGARVAQRQSNAEVYVYKHNDMAHLQLLLWVFLSFQHSWPAPSGILCIDQSNGTCLFDLGSELALCLDWKRTGPNAHGSGRWWLQTGGFEASGPLHLESVFIWLFTTSYYHPMHKTLHLLMEERWSLQGLKWHNID